ncbi:MAG TPA: CU044_5270 family protein [Gaiellaceae bacterium]|nr:CU044_5270 family protein [Gaiellaceae bacterium]
MPALEKIRELYPDPPPPSPEERARARLALVARMERPRRLSRRALLPAAGLAAAAAAAVIALVGVGDEAATDARAAAVLHDAAAKTKAQKIPGSGSVLYVKSVDAYLSTWADRGNFSVLVPHVREIWQGPEGGLLDTSTGEAKFLSERDRRRWIAAGRPNLREGGAGRIALGPQQPSDLPTDVDALFARLENEARGHSEGTHRQMFTRLGDYLRETNISPAQRAALDEVAARIPGVELVGPLRDSVGRRGVAVAMDHPSDGLRHTLVVDPKTGTLLAEQRVTLEENLHGYPAGTVVGHSTYLDTRMVRAPGVRPA